MWCCVSHAWVTDSSATQPVISIHFLSAFELSHAGGRGHFKKYNSCKIESVFSFKPKFLMFWEIAVMSGGKCIICSGARQNVRTVRQTRAIDHQVFFLSWNYYHKNSQPLLAVTDFVIATNCFLHAPLMRSWVAVTIKNLLLYLGVENHVNSLVDDVLGVVTQKLQDMLHLSIFSHSYLQSNIT